MFDERIALGLPSLAGYSLLGALTQASTLGVRSVMSFPDGLRAEHSLGPFPTLAFYGLSEEQKGETADLLAQYKHVAIHQAWDDQWMKWIDCAVCVGARVAAVHSARARDGQSFSEFLAERSAELRRIGVENERVDALNATILATIRTLNERLFSLHVHDVRKNDWRDHRCAGSGVIDFPALFTELGRIGYAGLFEVELEEPEKEKAAARTGEYLTRLCRTMPVKTDDAE